MSAERLRPRFPLGETDDGLAEPDAEQELNG
ncbi:hypothetical protein ACVIJ6_003518 [Bradyrhizobium sp. USDA 4369]